MPENNTGEFEYHCTECGAKVKASDKICPECKADLSEEVEDANDKIIILEYFTSENEALFAQGKLISENINSFITKDDGGGMEPQLAYTGGVKLLINEKDLEVAEKILKDKGTNDDFYETKCKYCGADVTLYKKEFDEGKYICPGCFKSNTLD